MTKRLEDELADRKLKANTTDTSAQFEAGLTEPVEAGTQCANTRVETSEVGTQVEDIPEDKVVAVEQTEVDFTINRDQINDVVKTPTKKFDRGESLPAF
jgi:hypothetical protein